MDYITLNRRVYDQTAEEFGRKIELRQNSDKKIADKLNHYLEVGSNKLKILDIGPGNGQMAKFLCEKGFNVVGIEFSEPMAKIAKNTAPAMELIVDNFLTHSFGEEQFSAILSVAFIHLFPENDCMAVLDKIYGLLNNDGHALISTTRHEKPEEGWFQKDNFQNKSPRFRKKFTKDELAKMLLIAKFKTVEYYENEDVEVKGKTWMTFIVKK